MGFSIIKWSILSLTLIFLIHHLYMFLLNNLTVPKIKDLVNKPNEQYRDIFATLEKKEKTVSSSSNNNKQEEQIMTDELSAFLNDLKQNTPLTQNKNTAIASSNDFLSGNDNTTYTPF